MTRRLAHPKKQVEAPAVQTDAFQPDAIYVDTNPILGAGWPTPSAQILEVMSRAEKLGIQLCLPEVVQQELDQHWLRELREEWKNTNTTIARLNKKGHSLVSYDRAAPLRSADDLLNAVRSRTQEFTRRFRPVPLTGRPLAEFVAMAVQRKAAFEDGGYGFQDSAILCSVLDDMKARGITSGVLVTGDKAFRSEGAVALASAAGVILRVVSDLDELDKLVRGLFNARIREFLEQERATLIAAFRERIAEVEKFLMDNFSVTASDLKIYGTLKKIDGLRVLDIENAHKGGFGFDEKPEGEGRVTLSADVRIALTLDIQHYEPQPQPRLKVGGEVPPHPLDPLSTFFGAALRLESNSKEVVAVVKAEATKTETGYTDFRFTGVYMKSDDAGFGGLFDSRRT